MSIIPEKIQNVLRIMHEAGYEAYIVGGCVRDLLIGREPNDFDVCTSALPHETEEVFRDYRVIETGIKHGTVTVLFDGEPVEITTYRLDGNYSDGRHPDSVSFTRSLREDLARRDFTVNAMAWSEESGRVDLYGGESDAAGKIIRCVGDPVRRFSEDALRILRALRFASVLGYEIEPETAKAAYDFRNNLNLVSGERIRVELEKLLTGRDAGRIIRQYAEILGAVIPEILPMIGYDQNNSHHIHNLLEHTMLCLESVSAEPVLRTAALLHDIGKPSSRIIGDDGIVHYWGHEKKSAEMADDILRRLKYDNASREKIVKLIENHWTDIRENTASVRQTMRCLGKDFYLDLVAFMRADNMSKAPEFVVPEYYDSIEKLGREVMDRGLCCSIRELAVTGKDLVSAGVQPGKEMGVILEKLLDTVISGENDNNRDDLLGYVQNLIGG